VSDDQFCPLCEVSLDLHPDSGDDVFDCEQAGRKADLLRRFGL